VKIDFSRAASEQASKRASTIAETDVRTTPHRLAGPAPQHVSTFFSSDAGATVMRDSAKRAISDSNHSQPNTKQLS